MLYCRQGTQHSVVHASIRLQGGFQAKKLKGICMKSMECPQECLNKDAQKKNTSCTLMVVKLKLLLTPNRLIIGILIMYVMVMLQRPISKVGIYCDKTMFRQGRLLSWLVGVKDSRQSSHFLSRTCLFYFPWPHDSLPWVLIMYV